MNGAPSKNVVDATTGVHWASKTFAAILGLGVLIWFLFAVGIAIEGDSDPENDVRHIGATLTYGCSGAAWAAAAYSFWKGRRGGWTWFVAPLAIFIVFGLLNGLVSAAMGRRPLH